MDPGILPDEGSATQLLPSVPREKLGQELALSQLSSLPGLPSNGPHPDYRLEQHECAMHLDSAMLTYTPAAGKLKHTDPQASRFDDGKSLKRKIFVNKEVLGRLVTVAEELNKAQAQIEIRKIIKREQKRLVDEEQALEALQDPVSDGDPLALADLMNGLETDDGTPVSESPVPPNPIRANRTMKRIPSAYRVAQVRYPAVLAGTAPKDRWGYFRGLQRLYPAANAVRPGHVAFGSVVPPPAPPQTHPMVTGAAAVKAAKALQREADRQAEAAVAAEAAAVPAASIAHMDTTVEAVMHANEVREARRALARQLAEEEGLPTETWWDIMQKRKKMVYFQKLLEEMSGRMDILRLHRAARVIQKAWRVHRRLRTRKASEEIALLQKELAHRKAMEAALRAAAEAAIREQQERERLRRKARPRTARINLPEGASGEQGETRGSGSGQTFSRATSARTLNWQNSLRGSIPASLSRAVSRNFSRAASQRRAEPPPEPEPEDEAAMKYSKAQNNLWAKIQALIGTDWDVDEENSAGSSSATEEEEEESEDDETEHERRLRLRRERNEARKARKAAAAEAASEEATPKRRRRKSKKASDASGAAPVGGAGIPTTMDRVVKQAVATAKVMAILESKRKKKKKRSRKGSGPGGAGVIDMRMLAQAAASLGMSVEAYVAMRNRKLGLAGPEEWQAPAMPDVNAEEVDEEEMKRMEEEARRELMQRAAQEYVAKARAAAAAQLAAKRAAAGAAGAAAADDAGPFASAAAAALASQAAGSPGDGGAADTPASSEPPSVALSGRLPSGAAPAAVPMLPLDDEEMNAEEAAAAFAAAAAPTLSIEESDVWELVKEKMRIRTAMKQLERSGNAEALMAAVEADIHGWGSEEEKDGEEEEEEAEEEEQEEEGEEEEQGQGEEDWPEGWGSEPSSESSAPRRRRRRKKRASSQASKASPATTPKKKTGGRAERKRRSSGGVTAASASGAATAKSDSEYDTMSEDEIRRAAPTTITRIKRAKAKAVRDLGGYYARRIRAKRAAAAAAEAALREERQKARAKQRASLFGGRGLLGPRVLAGPAWRPGGGGAAARRRLAESLARRAQPKPVATNFVARPYHPPPPPPPRVAERLATVMQNAVEFRERRRVATRAVSPQRRERTEPYQFSPGGPSLLYRQPLHRRELERPTVHSAVWAKGANMPDAVFTQFGWVPAATALAAQQAAAEEAARAADPLAQQVAALRGGSLTPALEAFAKQLGLGRDPMGSRGMPGGPLSFTHTTLHPAPGSPQARMVPPSGGSSKIALSGSAAFSVRSATPGSRQAGASGVSTRAGVTPTTGLAGSIPGLGAGSVPEAVGGGLPVSSLHRQATTGAPHGALVGHAPASQSLSATSQGALAHGRNAQGAAAHAPTSEHSSGAMDRVLANPNATGHAVYAQALHQHAALSAQGAQLLPHPPGQPPATRGSRVPIVRHSSASAANSSGGGAEDAPGVAAESSAASVSSAPPTRLAMHRAHSHGDAPLSHGSESIPASRGGSDTHVASSNRGGVSPREASGLHRTAGPHAVAVIAEPNSPHTGKGAAGAGAAKHGILAVLGGAAPGRAGAGPHAGGALASPGAHVPGTAAQPRAGPHAVGGDPVSALLQARAADAGRTALVGPTDDDVGPYRVQQYGPEGGLAAHARQNAASARPSDAGIGPQPRSDVTRGLGDATLLPLQGQALQVALTVLKTNAVKPAVARRLFPLGRARVMDTLPLAPLGPTEAATEPGDASAETPVPGPLSFPLDDISSSSYGSSDEDSGWATASEDGGEGRDPGQPAALGVGASSALSAGVAAALGRRHPGTAERGRVVSPRAARVALAAAATSAAPGGIAPSAPGPVLGTPLSAALHGADGDVIATAAVAAQAGQGAGSGHLGTHIVAGSASAAAIAARQQQALLAAAGGAPSAAGRLLKASSVHRASPAPVPPLSVVPPHSTAVAAVGGGVELLDPSLPLGEAANDVDAPEEAEEPVDEEDMRQFDLLYDMTRMAVAPPNTPRDHSPDADLVRITIRRSEVAKQREQEEVREERRARLLGSYAALYARSLGHAYERVQYRRRQARALAALAVAQSPAGMYLRSRTLRAGVRGTGLVAAQPSGAVRNMVRAAAVGGAGGASGAGRVQWGRRRPGRGRYPAGFGRRGAGAVAGEVATPESFAFASEARQALKRVRVRSTAACTSGFGGSYYWRQPVKLGSLMRINPAGAARAPAMAVGASLPGAAAPDAPPFPAGHAPRLEVAGSRPRTPVAGCVLELAAKLPLPEAEEVTEMASTALKLLDELGSEIGRMEEQIQALQRKAELEHEREERQQREQQAQAPPARSQQAQQGHGQAQTANHLPPGPVYRGQVLPRQSHNQQPQTPRNRLAHPQRQPPALPLLPPPTGISGTGLRIPCPPQQQQHTAAAAVAPTAGGGGGGFRSPGTRKGSSSGTGPSTAQPGAAGTSSHGRHSSIAAQLIASSAARHSSALAAARMAHPACSADDDDGSAEPGLGLPEKPAGGSAGPRSGSPLHSRSAPMVRLAPVPPAGVVGQPAVDTLELRPTPSYGSLATVSGTGGGEQPELMPPPAQERSWSPSTGSAPALSAARQRGTSPRGQLLPAPHNHHAVSSAPPRTGQLSGHARPVTNPSGGGAGSNPWEASADYDVVMLAGVSSPLAAANGRLPGPQAHYATMPSTAPAALLPSIAAGGGGVGGGNSPLGIVGLRPGSGGWQGAGPPGALGAPRAASPAHLQYPLGQSALHRQASEGRELSQYSPLSAWTAAPSVLPDISQAPNSPGARYTSALTPSGTAGSSKQAASALGTARAAQAAYPPQQSPPHSPNPYRNYPKMELGLGASGSPASRGRRRGSLDGPAVQYYSMSNGGPPGYDMYDPYSPRGGYGGYGVSVDSLLLNMNLLNAGRGSAGGYESGGGGSTDRSPHMTPAQRAAAVTAAARQPRSAEGSTLTATVPDMNGGSGIMGTRFARVRRSSVGPSPAGS